MPLITSIVRGMRKKLIENELKKNWKILDLGCGDMWLTKHLNKQGFRCIGLDTYDKRDSDYVRGTAYRIPFPDNFFDCVIGIEVIEHLEPRAYREIKRVLKKNGKFIVTTPKPKFDFIVSILQRFRLVVDSRSPHINLVNLEDLPFKMLKKKTILLIDQYGVLQNKK